MIRATIIAITIIATIYMGAHAIDNARAFQDRNAAAIAAALR